MKHTPVMAASPSAFSPQDEFLRTEHLQKDLKGRSISGGVITLTAQGGKFALNILSTAILARLLLPADFGLVAMITTITGFLSVFKDAGLSMATVQREKISHAQVSNLFWLNAGISVVLSLLVLAAAPLIAWLYQTPQLTILTMGLSITFLLDGLAIQHQAILSRQMRFKDLARIDIGSMLMGLLVSVSMASAGWGAWSLVGGSVGTSLAGLCLTWGLSRWRPQMPLRSTGTRSLVSFGANLTAANCFTYFTRNADTFLIGRACGAEPLGLYTRATMLMRRPLDQLLGPITAVVMPMLSRLQNDPVRYRRTFLYLYEAIALIGLPITGLVLALARPIVLVLLGPKWEDAAVIFMGFSLAMPYAPLACAACWLFESQGRGREMLTSNSILSVLAIASFLIGIPWGALGVAISFSVSGMLIRLPILFYIAGGTGPVTRKDLWVSFAKNIVSWVVVFAVARGALYLCAGFAPILQLAICGTAGMAAAIGFALIYPPQRSVALRLWETLRAVIAARSLKAADKE